MDTAYVIPLLLGLMLYDVVNSTLGLLHGFTEHILAFLGVLVLYMILKMP